MVCSKIIIISTSCPKGALFFFPAGILQVLTYLLYIKIIVRDIKTKPFGANFEGPSFTHLTLLFLISVPNDLKCLLSFSSFSFKFVFRTLFVDKNLIASNAFSGRFQTFCALV